MEWRKLGDDVVTLDANGNLGETADAVWVGDADAGGAARDVSHAKGASVDRDRQLAGGIPLGVDLLGEVDEVDDQV